MRAPDWLTARPVAHRGLHDIARGIVENMPGAVQAAIAGNFSIEVDIQLSADGEAMVHHDHALGRLTETTGPLVDKTAAELKALTFQGHGRADDVAQRSLRPGRRPRAAGDRGQEPF
ncbi:glycerophosphoryl diester phosphodiesterase [Bradyrhizobium sp. F1.13.4]